MNEQQRKKALDSWKGKRNNAQGHFFESYIKTACAMADYDFYLNIYHGGIISEDEWPQYRGRAEDQLAQYRRIYAVTAPGPDSEAMAVCSMAEALYSFDLLAAGQGGAVQSASIGSVSVSYSSPAAQAMDLSPKGQARELYRCACLYLDIYRGAG